MTSIPHFSRLFAIALLNYSDDDGHFWLSVPVIRGALFPFDEPSPNIRGAFADLSRIGFLEIGDLEGKHVCRISHFNDHQKIDKPQKARLSVKNAVFPSETWKFDEPSPNIPRTFQDGTGNREQGTGNLEEGSEERGTGFRPKPKTAPKFTEDQAQAIYQAYPKHEAKQDAIKAIRTALAKVAPDALLEAVQAYAAAVAEWSAVDREYIPLPASWIRAGRWEDDRKGWIRVFPTTKPPAVPGIAHQPPEWARRKIEGLKLELPEAERQIRIAKAQPFDHDLEAAERALTKIKAEILKLGGTV